MERETGIQRAKLANDSIRTLHYDTPSSSGAMSDSDTVETSDAIVETTPASLRVTKRKMTTSDSDLLTIDLIMEILKRLPVKTLARFLCVSKLWESNIRLPYFTRLHVAESSNRPGRLFFAFKRYREGCSSDWRVKGLKKDCFYFSTPQTQNPGEASVATYHMNHPTKSRILNSCSVNGLICYGPPSKLIVYNPSTRGSIALPEFDTQDKRTRHYLGYDPVDGDYKMLCMTTGVDFLAKELRVLTLGNGNSWRTVENCPPHSPQTPHICINGVLYYGVYSVTDTPTRPTATGKRFLRRTDHGVMSFDVRSEKFERIKIPPRGATRFTSMMRYDGKLALMYCGYGGICNTSGKIELWVLEDAAKHEWSYQKFDLPIFARSKTRFQVFCAIGDAQEFVLAPRHLQEPPFYVLYYNPKKESMTRVDIELTDEFWADSSSRQLMSIFPGQVDNLMFL